MGKMKEEFIKMQMQEAEDMMEKHHPIGQERHIDEAEFKREELMQDMFIRMSDDNNYEMLSEHSEAVAMQEQKQLITNQNNLKMKKVETNGKTEAKETKKEILRRLFKENNLVEEDVYKDKRGFVIICRSGIDKIVSKQNITIAYEVIKLDKDMVVLKAVGSMKTGNGEKDVRNMMSFGEASDDNLMGGAKKFPVAMAEKRAMSRVVLKMTGFYEQGVFGQDEIVD